MKNLLFYIILLLCLPLISNAQCNDYQFPELRIDDDKGKVELGFRRMRRSDLEEYKFDASLSPEENKERRRKYEEEYVPDHAACRDEYLAKKFAPRIKDMITKFQEAIEEVYDRKQHRNTRKLVADYIINEYFLKSGENESLRTNNGLYIFQGITLNPDYSEKEHRSISEYLHAIIDEGNEKELRYCHKFADIKDEDIKIERHRENSRIRYRVSEDDFEEDENMYRYESLRVVAPFAKRKFFFVQNGIMTTKEVCSKLEIFIHCFKIKKGDGVNQDNLDDYFTWEPRIYKGTDVTPGDRDHSKTCRSISISKDDCSSPECPPEFPDCNGNGVLPPLTGDSLVTTRRCYCECLIYKRPEYCEALAPRPCPPRGGLVKPIEPWRYLVPGTAINKFDKGKKMHWQYIVMGTSLGALATGTVFHLKSKRQYGNYKSSPYLVKRKEFYDKANRDHKISMIAFGVGITTWLTADGIVFFKQRKDLNKEKRENEAKRARGDCIDGNGGIGILDYPGKIKFRPRISPQYIELDNGTVGVGLSLKIKL